MRNKWSLRVSQRVDRRSIRRGHFSKQVKRLTCLLLINPILIFFAETQETVFSVRFSLGWIIRRGSSARRLRPSSQTKTAVIGPGVCLSCHCERVHHLGCNDAAREPLRLDWRLKQKSIWERWGSEGEAGCSIMSNLIPKTCFWRRQLFGIQQAILVTTE